MKLEESTFTVHKDISNSNFNPGLDYLHLNNKLCAAKNDDQLFQLIVNVPFYQDKIQTSFIFLGIICLYLVDEKEKNHFKGVAHSKANFGFNHTQYSFTALNNLKFNLNDSQNITAKTIRLGRMGETTDWNELFTPAISTNQARDYQLKSGIEYSAIYPLKSRGGGALIYGFFQNKSFINELQFDFMKKYTKFVDNQLSNMV
ncbi:MAG TPA: hypothetical protein VLF63_02125 [Patescibacteria group bacterium]|nr:hypothetical protein [Patescibacteria group bacterium]